MSVHFCGDYSQSVITYRDSLYMLFKKSFKVVFDNPKQELFEQLVTASFCFYEIPKQYKLAILQTTFAVAYYFPKG